MINLDNPLLRSIYKHALDCFPEEMCGVVINKADNIRFEPLENISNDKKHSFTLDPVEYAKLEPWVEVIFHSHINNFQFSKYDKRTPSYSDFVNQKKTAKPWGIVLTDGDSVSTPVYFPRIPSSNYLERPFLWYINDCYTLVQDYFEFELNIPSLIKYPDDFDWMKYEINGFKDFFLPYAKKLLEEEKIKPINDLNKLKNGDIIVINKHGVVNSHLGIFHNGEILHQDIISTLEPMSHYVYNISNIFRATMVGGNFT
jgi:proteasome lid subunit RPN8/RPN11